MEGFLTADKMGLALFFAVPGLIVTYIRSQFVVNKRLGLSDAALNYITLSMVYQAVIWPLTATVVSIKWSPWLSPLEWFGLLFIGPAFLGGLIGLNARAGWTRQVLSKLKINTTHPINSAWDWRFTDCEACWVLAVLKDGTQWAGYLGEGSFMSTDAAERDFYIEQVYSISDDNEWTQKGSGVWIANGELQSLEFWPCTGAPNG